MLPEVVIEESVATLPGLDGRKMSKSYDNTIPLFEGGAKRLKETIARIVTDSRLPGEAKDADASHLLTLYRAFANAAESDAFRADLLAGLGWGDAKQRLFERIERDVAPMRERYEQLIARPDDIEDILVAGAAKARAIATPLLAQLRAAVGLRRLGGAAKEKSGNAKAAKAARFVSFREKSGDFHFRLVAADGEQLLLSSAYENPKDVGAVIARLAATEADVSIERDDEAKQFRLVLDGVIVALCVFDTLAARDAAIDKIADALRQIRASEEG